MTDDVIRFLAARAVPGVEAVEAGVFRRSVRRSGGPAVVQLPSGAPEARALLGLDRDPRPAAEHLSSDPLLGPLVRRAPDRRIPGTVDAGELAVRAILGQQVTLAAAARLAGGLVARCGEPLPRATSGVTHLFPAPDALAALDPDSLPMPRARARALVGLAGVLASGALVLDGPGAREGLLAQPGIGDWTASYVAMRALGDDDAFLAGDAGVRHALERLGQDGSPRSATRLADRWRPYRAYAVIHLWASLPVTRSGSPKRAKAPFRRASSAASSTQRW